MGDVIFCEPNDHYDSYSDLLRLVRLSGYPMIKLAELDPDSDNVYFFSTPSTRWHDGTERHGWLEAKARIIYWNIEWYSDVDYRDIPGVEVWTADKWHADKLGLKYVPMGSHPDFPDAPLQDCPKVWDAAMLAYMPPRREQIAHDCKEIGISLAPRGWGLERHSILQQTRLMLHVHQYDYAQTVAPQRWAIAAAYKLPIVSETLAKGGWGDYVFQADYSNLARTVKSVRDDARLIEYGIALHNFWCVEHPFKRWIDEAL